MASSTSPTPHDHKLPTIVVAPDSLKGTATALEAARAIAEGIGSVLDCHIRLQPLADGGEGTSELFAGERITLPTTDANGNLTEASYRFDAEQATAYIDVAAASGLPKITTPKPTTADTYGTGVLIADAQTRGANKIVLGLGGSATTDGGTGILVALGATPCDRDGLPLRQGGADLVRLDHLDTAQLNIPAAAMEWVLLADVDAPATGPKGTAAVFAPQKGANPEDVEVLERGIARLCEVSGVNPTTAGLGAAGGVPIGLTWLSSMVHGTPKVHLLPGAAVVQRQAGLDASLEADLVVTAEGRFDAQSLGGKVIGTLLRNVAHVPVAIVAGSFEAEGGAMQVRLGEGDTYSQLRQAGREVGRRFRAGDFTRVEHHSAGEHHRAERKSVEPGAEERNSANESKRR